MPKFETYERDGNPELPLTLALPLTTVKAVLAFYGTEDDAESKKNDLSHHKDQSPSKAATYHDVDILREIIGRAWMPVADRCNKEYFFKPYSFKQGALGLAAGPLYAGLLCSHTIPYLSPIVAVLHLFSPFAELTLGIISMAKALYYKMQGDNNKANRYFRDGATRLLLAPCLLLTAVVAVPMEIIRFFTRLGATLLGAMRQNQSVGEEKQVAPMENHVSHGQKEVKTPNSSSWEEPQYPTAAF